LRGCRTSDTSSRSLKTKTLALCSQGINIPCCSVAVCSYGPVRTGTRTQYVRQLVTRTPKRTYCLGGKSVKKIFLLFPTTCRPSCTEFTFANTISATFVVRRFPPFFDISTSGLLSFFVLIFDVQNSGFNSCVDPLSFPIRVFLSMFKIRVFSSFEIRVFFSMFTIRVSTLVLIPSCSEFGFQFVCCYTLSFKIRVSILVLVPSFYLGVFPLYTTINHVRWW
jgi:hypothetical protein